EKQNGTCVHLPRTEPTGSPAAPRCNRLATTARKEALVFAYPVWSTGKSGGEKIAPPRRFFLRESDRLGSSVAQLIPIRSDSGVFGRRIEAMSLPQSTRELVAIGPVVFIPGFDKAGDELLRGFALQSAPTGPWLLPWHGQSSQPGGRECNWLPHAR